MRSSLIAGTALLACVGAIAGCAATNVAVEKATTVYVYRGERYGAIKIILSPALAADGEKAAGLKEVYLDKAIANRLIESNLFDSKAGNSIDVLITKFESRDLEGQVALKNAQGAAARRFTVSVTYGWTAAIRVKAAFSQRLAMLALMSRRVG